LVLLAAGLLFALFFAWAFELTPEGIKREREVDRSESITQVTGRKLNLTIIGVLALAVAYFAYDKLVVAPEREAALVEAAKESVAVEAAFEQAPAEPEKSIAVLPFVNMSSDLEQEFFADGISEELLNALAKVSELKVAGRTSSFAFKGKNDDLAAIGKLLRVNYILEGSVRKSGNRVRITSQLIKVDDGFHMWSDTYDRELNDIFAIQDEISNAILGQLRAQLLDDQSNLADQTDTRAYELYLLAKQRIYERNDASLSMAMELLEQALGIDPGYAPAHAQRAIAAMLLSENNYGTLSTEASGRIAKDSIERALSIDPLNAEALAGKGFYLREYELKRDEAISLLRQALMINPGLINAATWLATDLDRLGRLNEAREIREELFRRDPLHRPTFGNLQQKYMVMGEKDKALEMLDGLRAYMPGDGNLTGDYGQVYVMSGDLARSLEYMERSYELEPLNSVNRNWYGFALMNIADYERAAEVVTDALRPLMLSRLGRIEEALIEAEKVIGSGQFPAWAFHAFVENGRFEHLIREIESRWPTLEAFIEDWPSVGGYGSESLEHLAYAYRETGQLQKFSLAMQRIRANLDFQLEQGVSNWVMSQSQAYYEALNSDIDAAIPHFIRALEQGMYLDADNPPFGSVFTPLFAHDEVKEAVAAMEARRAAEMELPGMNAGDARS
jgi:TolB-like protein/Flp pilus assembly protein TadD